MSRFEFYLRTGRLSAEPELQTKFNPWHDPDDGRFTFARQGRFFGRGQSRSDETSANRARIPTNPRAPIAAGPSAKPSSPSKLMPRARTDASSSASRRQPLTPRQITAKQRSPKIIWDLAIAAERIQKEMRAQPSLRQIPGYPETGTAAWRAANNPVFTEVADKINRQRGLKPGDPKYIDPLLIKAWAMVESGGSRSAFLRDPMQVNNFDDWTTLKGRVTGLTRTQRMNPTISSEAALKWLEFKGYLRDDAGRPGPWRGVEKALQKYNGNSKQHPSGVPHSIWYAKEVLKLYEEAQKSR